MSVRLAGSTYQTLIEKSATHRHLRTRYTSRLMKLTHRLTASSPLQDNVGFPSHRILRDRRAQPLNDASKLTLVFSPIFLPSPAAFLNVDATGSSFGIRYRLLGLLFPQTSWNLLYIAPARAWCQTKNAILTGL